MKLYMFAIAFALFASALFGDSIPTYFASSATVTNGSLSAQGPFFQIGGEVAVFTRIIVTVGEGVPVQILYQDGNGEHSQASVEGFSSVLLQPFSVGASGESFTLPPNPKSSYTVPASAEGGVTAFQGPPCGPGSPPGTPPCGSAANLVIGLPGIITVGVDLSQFSPPNCTQSPGPSGCLYEIGERFVSTPEPSSAALVILSSGAIFLVFTKTRTKRRLSSLQLLIT